VANAPRAIPASALIALTVNGKARELALDGEVPLLIALRQDLRLKGTRFGCGQESCGACMVLVDGRPVPSCSTPLSAAAGKAVTTIEGLLVKGSPGPLQRIFLEEQAAQCGYCTNGIIVSLAGLLARRPLPGRDQILAFLDERHLCRCGAHPRILRALDRALSETGEGAP
jgi:nicotinate dehydrogenase subunit A